jgi:hypothetical protein
LQVCVSWKEGGVKKEKGKHFILKDLFLQLWLCCPHMHTLIRFMFFAGDTKVSTVNWIALAQIAFFSLGTRDVRWVYEPLSSLAGRCYSSIARDGGSLSRYFVRGCQLMCDLCKATNHTCPGRAVGTTYSRTFWPCSVNVIRLRVRTQSRIRGVQVIKRYRASNYLLNNYFFSRTKVYLITIWMVLQTIHTMLVEWVKGGCTGIVQKQ